MKRMTLSVLCGALLATAGLAQAQQPNHLSPEQLQQLDKDGSGDVSRQEYQEFMDASFDRLDADKDGHLTANEVPTSVTQEQFTMMDANKDGRISKEEFIDQVMADFSNVAPDGKLR